MDTLHDRLAELAVDAPTGGAPPAELWARGKRVHRTRAAALVVSLVAVIAVGTAIGTRFADGDGRRSGLVPATERVGLPITYPVGKDLPNLGNAPGPLAAIWLTPSAGSGAPEVVGLVASSGRFGTLPINVSAGYLDPLAYFALSPDGRRIAYDTPAGGLLVHDLASGQSATPAFDFAIRLADEGSYTWVDSTHLVGYHAAGTGGEADGWVWQPGTKPKMIDLMAYPGSPYLGPHAGVYAHPWFRTGDVVGVIGPKVVLTRDGDGSVVALDAAGAQNPALRRMVAMAGGPVRVTFATSLIGAALGLHGGAS